MNPLSAEARYLRRLKKLPLVRSIDDERWQNLQAHIDFRELEESEVLFAAGGKSENLYLVLDGELCLFLPRPDSAEMFYLDSRHAGDTAGDFAVLNGGAHLVSAIAATRCRVATFPAFAFERLIGIDKGILAHVYDTAAELSRRVTLSRVFLELFGELDARMMNDLLEFTQVQHYRSGEVLFEEGDSSDGLHIVVSGKLSVTTVNQAGHAVNLGEVRSPATVGELGLLSGSPRTATVFTRRESTIAFLEKQQFDLLTERHPAMHLTLTRQVVRRHIEHARERRKRSRDSNFVILPLDSRLPLRRFMQQLKREMRESGNPLMLESRGFDTLYGKRDAAQTSFTDRFNSAIAEWLDDKEERYSELIYLTDLHWSEWTRRCVHRADRILLLANASAVNDAGIREVERELAAAFAGARAQPPIDLVLLHPSKTIAPEHTARWLEPRTLDAFHHIRLDDLDHMARLARRLGGKARALVFSGGGARGYAHLGVQKVIEEAGLPVDYIGGSSMGGLLGASMAMGDNADSVYELSKRFANKRALFDYTLPVVALMKSAKLTAFCREVYGNTRIEDLWIPYFCVSSNLTMGNEVVHDHGELWRTVRATISLPGVFTPVPTRDGQLLIDGAVLNTFPVDIMLDKLGGTGKIIGVNVSQLVEIHEHYSFGPSLSGWRALLSRLNPFSNRVAIPRIAETLLRATDIKSIVRLNETRAMLEILIEPDVSEIALLDFKRFAEISEIGYREAQRVLQEHRIVTASQIGAKSEAVDVVPAALAPRFDDEARLNAATRSDGA